jgi:hypothetical protein
MLEMRRHFAISLDPLPTVLNADPAQIQERGVIKRPD